MNINRVTLRVLAITASCFILSYITAVFAGINQEKNYPISLVKSYGEMAHKEMGMSLAKNVPIANLNTVNIQTNAIDVLFTKIQNPKISILLEGKSCHLDKTNPLTVSENGKELTIKTNEKNSDQHWFDYNDNCKLIVDVPNNINDIKINTDSGDVKATKLGLKDLGISTVSGDISIQDLKINTVATNTTSGDINLSGQFDTLNAKNVSGDINLNSENTKPNLYLNSVSGDIKIQFISLPHAFLNFSTVSGSLNIAKELGNAIIKQEAGATKPVSSQGLISVKSVSGDLTIQRKK